MWHVYHTGQLEIQTHVLTRLFSQMNLNGQNIVPGDEGFRLEVKIEKEFLCRAGQSRCGKCFVRDRGIGHVRAQDFGSVEMNDGSVVAQESQPQAEEFSGISHGEGITEPGCNVLVG